MALKESRAALIHSGAGSYTQPLYYLEIEVHAKVTKESSNLLKIT
jgi:hypothetical protein